MSVARESVWEGLASLGLPLGRTSRDVVPESPDAIEPLVIAEDAELDEHPDLGAWERKRESLQAFLWALHLHFPSRYRAWFEGERRVEAYCPSDPSGRVIKLARIAVAALAKRL